MEQCFEASSQQLLLLVVGPVDLGDDRRHHRRARRHFGDLDRRSELASDGSQFIAYAAGNFVAGTFAAVLVDEIDLDIAGIAVAAQVVLPHQAVEVDR